MKEIERLEKEAWRYRLPAVNAQITVWDFDKDRVRPYVKDYLNRRWASLESRLLWFAVLMGVISAVFAWYAGTKADTNAKAVNAMVKEQQTQKSALDVIRNNAK